MKKLLILLLLQAGLAQAADLTCSSFDNRDLCKRVLAAGEKQLDAVTAEQAFKQYSANEVAADQVFKGKYVAIRGKILEISKDWRQGVVLTLRGGPGLLDRVQLRLFERQVTAAGKDGIISKKVEDLASKLKIGQTIEAECKGGGMMLKTPIFRECLL